MLQKIYCKIVLLKVLIVVLQNSNRIVHIKSCFDRNDITVPGLKINFSAWWSVGPVSLNS